jgi:hypothetical protein
MDRESTVDLARHAASDVAALVRAELVLARRERVREVHRPDVAPSRASRGAREEVPHA